MSTTDVEAVKLLVCQAFADVPYPGDEQIVPDLTSWEEYVETWEYFRGRTDWRTLSIDLLNEAFTGWGPALAFFTPQAFRFYLPAYLLADLDLQLREDIYTYSYLTWGLTAEDQQGPTSRAARKQAQQRGGRTKFEVRSERFASFTSQQAGAIVIYLEYILHHRADRVFSTQPIAEALELYWRTRADPAQG